MNSKRNNELVERIEKILESNEGLYLTEEERKDISRLLESYKSATWKDKSDREAFYESCISDMVNDFGFNEKEMAKSMANDHPTLQQSQMRLAKAFILEMANKPYCDGRNQASVELAKRLKPIIEESDGLPYI